MSNIDDPKYDKIDNIEEELVNDDFVNDKDKKNEPISEVQNEDELVDEEPADEAPVDDKANGEISDEMNLVNEEIEKEPQAENEEEVLEEDPNPADASNSSNSDGDSDPSAQNNNDNSENNNADALNTLIQMLAAEKSKKSDKKEEAAKSNEGQKDDKKKDDKDTAKKVIPAATSFTVALICAIPLIFAFNPILLILTLLFGTISLVDGIGAVSNVVQSKAQFTKENESKHCKELTKDKAKDLQKKLDLYKQSPTKENRQELVQTAKEYLVDGKTIPLNISKEQKPLYKEILNMVNQNDKIEKLENQIEKISDQDSNKYKKLDNQINEQTDKFMKSTDSLSERLNENYKISSEPEESPVIPAEVSPENEEEKSAPQTELNKETASDLVEQLQQYKKSPTEENRKELIKSVKSFLENESRVPEDVDNSQKTMYQQMVKLIVSDTTIDSRISDRNAVTKDSEEYNAITKDLNNESVKFMSTVDDLSSKLSKAYSIEINDEMFITPDLNLENIDKIDEEERDEEFVDDSPINIEKDEKPADIPVDKNKDEGKESIDTPDKNISPEDKNISPEDKKEDINDLNPKSPKFNTPEKPKLESNKEEDYSKLAKVFSDFFLGYTDLENFKDNPDPYQELAKVVSEILPVEKWAERLKTEFLKAYDKLTSDTSKTTEEIHDNIINLEERTRDIIAESNKLLHPNDESLNKLYTSVINVIDSYEATQPNKAFFSDFKNMFSTEKLNSTLENSDKYQSLKNKIMNTDINKLNPESYETLKQDFETLRQMIFKDFVNSYLEKHPISKNLEQPEAILEENKDLSPSIDKELTPKNKDITPKNEKDIELKDSRIILPNNSSGRSSNKITEELKTGTLKTKQAKLSSTRLKLTALMDNYSGLLEEATKAPTNKELNELVTSYTKEIKRLIEQEEILKSVITVLKARESGKPIDIKFEEPQAAINKSIIDAEPKVQSNDSQLIMDNIKRLSKKYVTLVNQSRNEKAENRRNNLQNQAKSALKELIDYTNNNANVLAENFEQLDDKARKIITICETYPKAVLAYSQSKDYIAKIRKQDNVSKDRIAKAEANEKTLKNRVMKLNEELYNSASKLVENYKDTGKI